MKKICIKNLIIVLGIFWLSILPHYALSNDAKIDIKTQFNQGIDSQGNGYKLEYDYPQIKLLNRKIQNKINKYFTKNLPEKSSIFSQKVQIVYQSNKLICFYMKMYQHDDIDGAAHGQMLYYGLTFDLKTGNELKLGDLFLKNTNYKSIIDRKAKQIIDKEDYAYKAEFTGIKNDQNYYITNEKLIILFGSYLYSSFARSPLKVEILLEDFDDMLKYDRFKN